MLRRSSLTLRPNVVVVGTGWAGAYFAKDIDTSYCNLQVLSVRNHHVFTPLLPQTTTGTLEFRSVCEPIFRIQPSLAYFPSCFYRCFVHNINFKDKEVNCVGVGVVDAGPNVPVNAFNVKYDKLILAHGAHPTTFNVPGVGENAFFLREVHEAREIRKRLVQNMMTADLPTTSVEEKKRLLTTVVVGGGPTGIEFASTLTEFFYEDVRKMNPRLVQYCQVVILEAAEVLGTFDQRVRQWGARRLRMQGVKIVKAAVVSVTDREVRTKDGSTFPTGLVVWSTGVGPATLTKDIDVDRTSRGRISIDNHLRVLKDKQPIDGVYAIGDCAANEEVPLPTLAAVASRQGTFLAKHLNNALAGKPTNAVFEYKSLGSMVSLGSSAAVVELQTWPKVDFVGLKALYFWRSAYLGILGSWRSKFYVLINWLGSSVFGRDTTYIADIKEDQAWRFLAKEEVTRLQERGASSDKLRAMEAHATLAANLLNERAEKEIAQQQAWAAGKNTQEPELKRKG